MTTTIEESKQIVRDLITSLSGQSAARPNDFLTEDAVLWVLGQTPISGVYRGVAEIKTVLVNTLLKRLATFSVNPVKIISDGEAVAAQVEITATSHDGRIYNPNKGPDAVYCRVKDRRIAEIRFFPNTADIETALFGPIVEGKRS